MAPIPKNVRKRIINGAVFKPIQKRYFKGAAQKDAANLRDKTHKARVIQVGKFWYSYVEDPTWSPSELKKTRLRETKR